MRIAERNVHGFNFMVEAWIRENSEIKVVVTYYVTRSTSVAKDL